MTKAALLASLNKLPTTELEHIRLQKNLSLREGKWAKKRIQRPEAKCDCRGKNIYVTAASKLQAAKTS
ncbi:hypothetical protein D822_07963 [Streptococcus ratti FA-1 = DSM 20564]|uniref:DUF3781 domain-containing protein n=2 Tax=Streptococcus ratti TaxID=1341 RepID=A0A7X9QGC8_STRRT|nr:hypothetical protein SRA_02671 [Streptococcus ratti FA-1 = DSM 20564]EMP69468.1 hypothetical protein D822_07963 [Streptococcus ratti FA-1 = DSM 20564]NMD48357.1 DUF3781 domain-containing protein [Streptococcus ratti]QEY07293.1 DUF3781 domain-containing protein [Streptococcus ratti]